MDFLSDYDYDLPEDLIAQVPLPDRASSRLLRLNKRTGSIQDRTFRDIETILEAGDLLIWNDTRVSALRLFGQKPTGGAVEALLLKQTAPGIFECLVKPGKRLKPGSVIEFAGGLVATVRRDLDEPIKELQFEPALDLEDRLREHGLVPLPPYIQEKLADPERYQTVYSQSKGSAAAPTAGLHFTPELIDRLKEKGVNMAQVTLDVSLDTFRPVTSENLSDHKMHGEVCRLPLETAQAIQNAKGRIIAVGTTTARTLESFAVGKKSVEPGEMRTSIFIRPGYNWQVLDGMFTNFHMPRTTLLMMISALAGRSNVMQAYAHATQHGYRFLSFGDSMLIL
ncbi:MAG: tRNA preQ1(34) S-adenosylmethionine ribosyltransferase-isomerase QueA [Chlorobia bacterium]|nr:tRNA preQ1(34) S-adenosylmethionine ribosyltransferase-isomerase QueA [Fimbriimonadaceae bacterium]